MEKNKESDCRIVTNKKQKRRCRFVGNKQRETERNKRKKTYKLLIIVIILFILLMLAGTLLLQHRKNVDREQRKAEAIAALERVPTVTPTPAATPTPTPTPIPTVTPTPVLERAYVFNPEDYLGTGAVRTAGLKSKLRNSVRSRLPLLIHRQIRKRQFTCKAKVKKIRRRKCNQILVYRLAGKCSKGLSYL